MNIVVDLGVSPIKDGTEVVFRSPVDCSQVTGLKVYHSSGVVDEFIFADAHGNNVGDIDHLFAENVAVKVILDTTTGMAFVQNPDTNSYLEGRFAELEAMIEAAGGESSGIVNTASGSSIVLRDSAEAPLKGLTISGTDAETVTVKVTGKNIGDLRKYSTGALKTASAYATKEDRGYGTTLSATSGNSVTVTQSKWPNTTMLYHSSNGFVVLGFYCPLRVGDWVTISLEYEITNNPLNVVGSDMTLQLNAGTQSTLATRNNRLYYARKIKSGEEATADGWNYLSFAICGTSGVISNFQVAYGSDVVDYEPYQEPQTLVVTDIDNIDCAQLHTYKPTTTITNDVGAEMSVTYVADTKAYIDNKFTELQNAILASGANV